MDRRSVLATSRKTAHRPVAARETVQSAGRWCREASGRGGNTPATHSPGPRRRPLARRRGKGRRPLRPAVFVAGGRAGRWRRPGGTLRPFGRDRVVAMTPVLPRFRSDLTVSEQRTHDGTVFVVKDPVTREFYRLGETERFISEQCDGSTPAEVVGRRTGEKVGAALPAEA